MGSTGDAGIDWGVPVEGAINTGTHVGVEGDMESAGDGTGIMLECANKQ